MDFFGRKNVNNSIIATLILIVTIIIFTWTVQTSGKHLSPVSDENINVDSIINTEIELELESETTLKDSSVELTTEEYRENSNNVTVKVQLRAPCNYPVITDQKDYLMGTIELLERAGYKTETHYVTTKDGYIFQIHRIPAVGKPVVYALHGFVLSSRDFVINCDGRALAHKLANDGYDVWLGNFRGNTYGRNHTTLSPKSKAFWSFSMDEIFAYDAPAAVDYILNVTGQEKLNWIGFSFGNSALFGMLSLYPEYNDKINLGVSLACEVFLGNSRSPVLRFFAGFQRLIETFFDIFWNGEAFGGDLVLLYNLVAPTLCMKSTERNRPNSCPATLWYVDGRDPKQINHGYLPLIAGGIPSSTSGRLIGQSLQWITRGKFEKYQFRSDKENLAKYGSIKPPEYNITSVKIPILNFWSENDFFSSKDNAMKAVKQLPNVIENIRVNWTKWNHLDYLYGKDADILIYDHLLKVLRQWNIVSY